ncbi:MAG: polyphosphate polymerase domain-containing protein [Lachnospiraceae bacterium]|nr:polyphosphate polymerase domain-containing protein [Lachnospiraceae bacterium]
MALEYRHELKYVVAVQQIECLRSRIRSIMPLDRYAGEKGKYNIRSVYFDDYRNSCYLENEDGTSPREKFRMRIYNADSKEIHLELKRKDRGKTHKDSCILTETECRAFLNGRGLSDSQEKQALLRKFCIKYKAELYRPKVIVEYEREPYVYRNGNVRITFDMDIRSSNQIDSFFEKKLFTRPIMPSGYHLLEVKYDEYLPDHIYRSLQLDELYQTTFSKYYLCRRYNIGGVKKYGF